ncbi:MAG: hypothetical protein MI924_07730 [Chloroflexales bacterium]|nr:hypothetical protein [Chloroflexales bacterium]
MTTVPQSRSKGRMMRPSLPVIIAVGLIIILILTLVVQNTLFRPADVAQQCEQRVHDWRQRISGYGQCFA